MQAERLTRQISAQPNINGNISPDKIHVNGPIRPIPITPLVIQLEIPQPSYAHPNNGRGTLQTPMIDQYNILGALTK